MRAALCYGKENKMAFLQTTMTTCHNCLGKEIEMIIEPALIDFENIIGVIEVRDSKLEVMVDGTKS